MLPWLFLHQQISHHAIKGLAYHYGWMGANCSVPHEITSVLALASREESRGINTRSWSRPPYFSLSSDLHTSLRISSVLLVHNKQSYWLPKSSCVEGRREAGRVCVEVCVCGCYWRAMSQLLAIMGRWHDCRGRCCSRRFEVLNDPGVAWLMEGFTWYFSNFGAVLG